MSAPLPAGALRLSTTLLGDLVVPDGATRTAELQALSARAAVYATRAAVRAPDAATARPGGICQRSRQGCSDWQDGAGGARFPTGRRGGRESAMECMGCGSARTTERRDRTAQGYRRFRCCACGRGFNERSAGVLNRTQYPSDVIALVVLWRLRYRLTLRDLTEMFLLRGIVFSHEAVRN